MSDPKLSEDTVRALPKPPKGNRVHFFAGHKLQGKVAPAGFGVRITSAGARTFVLDYRVNGTKRRFSIGAWKESATGGGWSVIAAIDQAQQLRKQIDLGNDPQAEKEKARSPEPEGKTVGTMLDEHVARYLKKSGLRSAEHIERTFERLVKPRIGKVPLHHLKRSHVVEMLDAIEDENGPVMADRVLAYVRKAFNWHAARDDEFNSPIVRGMARTKPKERARRRILDDQEIKDVWATLDEIRHPICYPRYVRALLLTAQRRDEVAKMVWNEIDGDTWIIPAARYKTGMDNTVPLSKAALEVIGAKAKDAAGPYVFSTDNGRSGFGGYGKAKAALDVKVAALRAKDGRGPMPRWTHHDLRRSARSLMSRAGVPGDVGERCLGHVVPGMRAVYDHHHFAGEKRDAFERLAALIERILNPPADNVVNIEEAKAK